MSSPNTLFGELTPTESSIFNFDIPSSASAQTCSLVFLFPEKSLLETSSYDFEGSGQIKFSKLSQPVDVGVTFSTLPAVADDYGVTTMAPGNSYTIASFPCPAGEKVSYEMSNGDMTSFKYFQDFNPEP